MPPLRIDRPDRLLLRTERVEERDEGAALQVRHRQVKRCSPAKAGVQGDVKPTSRCTALDPGFRRGTAVGPNGTIAKAFQGPWSYLSFSAALFLFRAKTQRRKEEGLGRQALFPVDAAVGRTVAMKNPFAAGPTSWRLCVFARKTSGTALTG